MLQKKAANRLTSHEVLVLLIISVYNMHILKNFTRRLNNKWPSKNLYKVMIPSFKVL